MAKVIGIRFQNNGNIYSCETGDLNPNIGDYVIVEMPYGIDLGEVAIGILELDEKIKKNQTAKIVRMATILLLSRLMAVICINMKTMSKLVISLLFLP